MQAKWGQNCNWPGHKTKCQTTRSTFGPVLGQAPNASGCVYGCVCVYACLIWAFVLCTKQILQNSKRKTQSERNKKISHKNPLAFDFCPVHLRVCVCVYLCEYACVGICAHLHLVCQKRVLCTLKPGTGYIIFSGLQLLSLLLLLLLLSCMLLLCLLCLLLLCLLFFVIVVKIVQYVGCIFSTRPTPAASVAVAVPIATFE